MAKDSGKKAKKKRKKKLAAEAAAAPAIAAAVAQRDLASDPGKLGKTKAGRSKVGKAVRKARVAARWFAENPLMAEVVAAALVAAAAALRDPARARRLAAEAAADLENAAEGAAERTSDMWRLALDIARRSIEAIGREEPRMARSTPHRSSIQ